MNQWCHGNSQERKTPGTVAGAGRLVVRIATKGLVGFAGLAFFLACAVFEYGVWIEGFQIEDLVLHDGNALAACLFLSLVL